MRAAISAQGVGLIEDIGRTVGKAIRTVDDTFEKVVRRIFFRKRRPLPTDHAGLLSRALAYLIDGVFVNLGFAAAAALVTLVVEVFGGGGNGGTSFAIAVGSTVWVAIGSLYLIVFWSLAGQTPGMRFVGIRLAGGHLPPRRSLRRLLGLGLSVVTFGFGFLGIVFREDRRGWEDRLSDSDVAYDERRPEPAPWSDGPGARGRKTRRRPRCRAPPRPRLRRSPGAIRQPPLHQQGERARDDQQRDVGEEDDEGAERVVDAAGAEGDAEVGGGRDRRHRDRDADRGAGPGLEGEHRRDPGGERDQHRRVVDVGEGGEARVLDPKPPAQDAGRLQRAG